MKKVSLLMASCILGSLLTLATAAAEACSYETLNQMVSVKPYSNEAGAQTGTVLDTLALCDENLSYAGLLLARQFAPYADGTGNMSRAIMVRAATLPSELAQGLGTGLAGAIQIYAYNGTVHMLNAILSLGKAHAIHAKTFALELLKKQNPYADANSQLLRAVQYLQQYAQQSQQQQPSNGGSSIWSFRSQKDSCDNLSGPWGRYEICPRYYASVSDQFGNRVVLACKTENAGIEFRVSFGNSLWNRISNTRVQSLAFGTGGILQSMGVPYVVERDQTLLAEEVLAPEMLTLLRSSNDLVIDIRANSGEVRQQLKFTLSGSNKAIGQLLSVCQ